MKTAMILASLLFAGLAQAQTPPVGTFAIDAAHSKVGFEIAHLVISSVEGRFDDVKGNVDLAKNFTESKVNVNIKTDSIDTGVKDRNDHLKSPDFFDAKKFPEITFKSSAITGTPAAFQVTGDLTMHGVTKKVTLDGKFLGAVKGMMGEDRVAFDLKGKLQRKDFGLTWNKAIEAGPVVGEEVTLSFKVEATSGGKKK